MHGSQAFAGRLLRQLPGVAGVGFVLAALWFHEWKAALALTSLTLVAFAAMNRRSRNCHDKDPASNSRLMPPSISRRTGGDAAFPANNGLQSNRSNTVLSCPSVAGLAVVMGLK